MEITRRYRVSVSTSVKGVKSYDCTVEITANEEAHNGPVMQVVEVKELIIAESDALVAELDKRYPPPKE